MTNTVVVVDWIEIKNYAINNTLSMKHVLSDNNYIIRVSDTLFILQCTIPLSNPPSQEQTDFEINFKH